MSFETYENYGSMSLSGMITKIWPWVGAEDAGRIANECFSLPTPLNRSGRKSEKAYRYGRHAFAEARKLKK